VRFGNVLGSSGSVVSVMLDRIHAGRPIEVTDPRAERFFMSGREAVSLVLVADQIGTSGEIYWLDMGAPVRIGDLVERLLTVAEAVGLRRVPTRVIGLRPGEKLREELESRGLELMRTRHPRIWVARQPAIDRASLARVLKALRLDVRRNDAMAALADLCAAVPEFHPSAEAKRWAARASMEASTSGAVPSQALIA
jgi:FlaA1/EpsC-like NDP-sugar epimerase